MVSSGDADWRPAVRALTATEVCQRLGTGPAGLSAEEAARRLADFGPNRIRTIRGRPLYWDFLANFTHVMALLLWAGGLIAFMTETPELGVAIWLVNLINGSFSFWQEYKAEKAVEALRGMLPVYARVIRDGQESRILAADLVPGDLLLLSEGDRISADGRLVQADDLRLDQSALTGESTPVAKTSEPILRVDMGPTEAPNLIFSGTCVVAGTGKAAVLATGMHSEFGKIAHLTQCVGAEGTPLQRELRRVTGTITLIALSVGAVFVGLVHAIIGTGLAASFMIGLGMVIAFVPEGLLPTLTLSLAIGVQRMAQRHALIKRLSSVETLGRTTVICTDKTGTLTENQMTVSQVWLGGRTYMVTGSGYAPAGEILQDGRPVSLPVAGDLRDLLVAAGLCNDSHLVPPHTESPHWTALGDPTEAALLVVAAKGGLDLQAERRQRPRVAEIPFNSYRKRMTTVHSGHGNGLAYVKGAPHELVALCRTIRWEGAERPLTDELRARVLAANDSAAAGGLRILAIAMRRLPVPLPAIRAAGIETELTLLGLVAMLDPPRADVAEVVATCHAAGIRIIMLTGDSP